MILVGLKADFFPEGGTIQNPEFEFKIEREGYKARGFIDLPILYKKKRSLKSEIINLAKQNLRAKN